ncbi:MAG: PAS domain-containing protein, partial [Chloroflexota bacterium]
NRFTQEDEDHLMAFTNQLAIAIQQARFIEQLQDNADKLEQRVQERTAELHLVNDDLRQQIVQRKLAETERQREQALLRTLIDNLPDNIYVKDTEQRYLVANNAIMTTLLNGKTHDEIVGKTNRQLFGDLDWVAERAIQDAQLLESGEAIVEQEYKTQHTTNPTDWYLITKIPLRDNKGKIIGFVGINRDISQLKRIQLQLAEERNLLRTVIDTIPDNIYVKDTEQRFMMVNRTLHQFLFQDYDMQEIIGKSNRDLFGEDAWVSEREQADNHLLTSGTPIYEQEYQIPETNMGIERGWFLLTKVPIRDANGDIYAYLGINRDLTTLKKVQQQLSDERNLLRTIIDTIPDQIYVKDNEGKFLIANRATIEHAAHVETEADLIGKDDYALHPSIADETHTEEQALIDETLPAIRRLDTFLGDNGTTQHLMVNKLPLRNADGTITGVVGINHDLTALKQAEAQLKQVLHSARCLLWSAIVSYDAQTETYTWDYQIANIEAAQSFLPLMHNDDTLSYEARWLAAIPQDQQAHRETTFADHAKQGQDAYTLEFHLYADDAQTKVWLNEDVLIESQDNDLWHVVGVCTDITTRKHAEQQLQLINEELEQRVEERTEELTEALNIQMQEIVERLQAVERERQQRMRAEALRDSVAMLNSNLNRDAIFDQLLLTLRDVIPHDASNVMLIENGVATVVRASGYEHQILDFSYKVDDFEDLRTVYETREAFIIPDIHTYEPWRDITTFGWVHSNLTVPIISHDEVIGFMNLDHHKVNFFTQEHANWLMSFGDQAGIAIRNARYTEELEQRVQERTQELEFEQSQLKAILDAMNDGVIYTDNDRQPQYINQSLVDIAGYTSEEWLNGTAQANINTRDTEYVHNRWQETLRTLDKRDFWDLEVRLRHKDGNEFDAHIVRTVVRNIKDERVGIVTVLRDISDEKRLREQKARFIATAAHELRTPIANIKTRLFLMRRKPERFMEHIEIAESVTNLMQNLVEHMFDITRFERGIMTLSYEKVTLNQLLSEIIQYQAP